MKRDKCTCEFTITDLSKRLSVSEVQNATLSLFGIPMRIPEENSKSTTLEEFILEGWNKC